ncbi:Response regulator receiver domain-containing protein [Gillisia sp. Hel1_33_143]|uniref:response regulator n=1 Tax=Gillisia sp. Hel1_33_143 TaxID=1336796 RepID=UPI0008794087|nr:response regulator [Gillisia sp. Hel1_33_143]SDS01539.1 Response regulator receiver domain-containing protein [Gillisia sp. Hel1_33_143]
MKKDICVIDDDMIYQLIIKKMINRSSAFGEIVVYSRADIALDYFKNSEVSLPTVILLDINMPEMDGWQFLEALKEYRPQFAEETKIYIVTSSIATSDKSKANAIPEISGFLSKPVSIAKLRELGENLY